MIVVIPARGGSKRLPQKNIYPLNGRRLLEYTLDEVSAAKVIFPIYLSTDDKKIANVALGYPQVEVLYRPKEIAKDNASTESVLLHTLDMMKKRGLEEPKWIMTLPPTNPFRSAATIRKFINFAETCNDNIDCIMSVTENKGDFWKKNDFNNMERIFQNAPRRQQEREPIYEENSAIYVTRTKALKDTGLIFGKIVFGINISRIEGFDINTVEDIKIAERIQGVSL